MDQTDLRLCLLLLANSRTPVRELGDKLGLSVAAVHGRLQALRDEGIIKAFTARIGLGKLQATTVMAWGTSRAPSNEDILNRLRRDDRIYWVAFGGAGVVYVGGYLPRMTDLDGYVSFLAKEAELTNPVVGIMPMGSGLPDEPVLDRTNCRILRALQRDARRSIADVAAEIGLSTKTVGRRLERMLSDGSAELSMEWYPDAANDVICMWELDLRPGAVRDEAAVLLMNKYPGNLLFAMSLSNLPTFLLAATWTGSMKDLRDLQGRLGKEKPFARLVPNVLYTGSMMDTWRDALLLKWAGSAERTP